MKNTNEIRRLKKAATEYTIINLLMFGVNLVVVGVILWKMKIEEFDFIMKIGARDFVLNIIFLIFNSLYYFAYHIKIDYVKKMIIASNIIAVLFMLNGNRISFLIFCICTCMLTELWNVLHVFIRTSDL